MTARHVASIGASLSMIIAFVLFVAPQSDAADGPSELWTREGLDPNGVLLARGNGQLGWEDSIPAAYGPPYQTELSERNPTTGDTQWSATGLLTSRSVTDADGNTYFEEHSQPIGGTFSIVSLDNSGSERWRQVIKEGALEARYDPYWRTTTNNPLRVGRDGRIYGSAVKVTPHEEDDGSTSFAQTTEALVFGGDTGAVFDPDRPGR